MSHLTLYTEDNIVLNSGLTQFIQIYISMYYICSFRYLLYSDIFYKRYIHTHHNFQIFKRLYFIKLLCTFILRKYILIIQKLLIIRISIYGHVVYQPIFF